MILKYLRKFEISIIILDYLTCNQRYKNANVIPMVLHNRSNYDYYLTIKEFSKEFEGLFECSGENRGNGYFFQCQ